MNLEAIKHYEKMLALNPNDNQGVRDPLLGLHLATDNLEKTQELNSWSRQLADVPFDVA